MTHSAYAQGSTSTTLLEATIGDFMRAQVEAHPDSIALISRHQDVSLSWAEMWEESGRAARGLIALGVCSGDRVAIWAGNCVEWVITQYAAARIGAVLVCVNPMYKASELQHALADSGAKVIVAAPNFRDAELTQIIGDARPDCPDLTHVITLGSNWDWLLSLGDSLGEGTLEQFESCVQAFDPVNIQYTSGTTGNPKGAVLTHRNILNNAALVGEGIGLSNADRVCVPVPLFHCFGMVLGVLGAHTASATLVLPAESFEVDATIATVRDLQCTALYGVPTMFVGLLAETRKLGVELSTLRTGLMGGAPCAPDLRRKIREELPMPDLSVVCGMTETSPISTQTLVSDPIEARDGTVGRPTPHVEIKVVDPVTGETLNAGETGEQCARGYSVMAGYWNNQEATDSAIDADGWLHTGDLATMDADGYLTLVGRIKDIIIRGGENIYPVEIEGLLRSHPAVQDAYVIGVPDERLGEQVMAWISLTADAIVDTVEDELRTFCSAAISRSKVPAVWRFTDTFPTTASGKVQKFQLREMAKLTEGISSTV